MVWQRSWSGKNDGLPVSYVLANNTVEYTELW